MAHPGGFDGRMVMAADHQEVQRADRFYNNIGAAVSACRSSKSIEGQALQLQQHLPAVVW
jgi:hypothetical protein